ncbi:MAG: hypothetical protein QY322_03380 [bacterium]|nr:MAG: hypothetical protein QY322_03380 [bacterium]
MTTIINTPQPKGDTGGGMGVVIGLVVLIIFGFLFYVYGLPALRKMDVGSPQINVPSTIDVNVNQEE